MKLTVNQLGKRIAQRSILEQVSFDWQPGEIIGLVGRNGAGKTTLMRTMVNQYLPDSGDVLVDGKSISVKPLLRQSMIYIDPANVFFKRMTLTQIMDYYTLAYPNFDQKRFVEMVESYKLSMVKQYGTLSKGYQALVVMMVNLASNAPLILLDEPFDGLDLFIREAIVQLVIDTVSNGQRGFLIASHNLEELDGLADRILFLKQKTISHDVNLEAARSKAVKLQLVFPGTKIPAVVHENGKVLNVSGRVIEALFADYTPELEAALKTEEPVLFETLPLSLTDLFKNEYQVKGA